jgi:hypothetical protein
MTTPNAYNATLVSIEPVSHPKGLKRVRVTWEENGKRYAANTLPGTATIEAQEHPADVPARIILNGRHQIILVDKAEA